MPNEQKRAGLEAYSAKIQKLGMCKGLYDEIEGAYPGTFKNVKYNRLTASPSMNMKNVALEDISTAMKVVGGIAAVGVIGTIIAKLISWLTGGSSGGGGGSSSGSGSSSSGSTTPMAVANDLDTMEPKLAEEAKQSIEHVKKAVAVVKEQKKEHSGHDAPAVVSGKKLPANASAFDRLMASPGSEILADYKDILSNKRYEDNISTYPYLILHFCKMVESQKLDKGRAKELLRTVLSIELHSDRDVYELTTLWMYMMAPAGVPMAVINSLTERSALKTVMEGGKISTNLNLIISHSATFFEFLSDGVKMARDGHPLLDGINSATKKVEVMEEEIRAIFLNACKHYHTTTAVLSSPMDSEHAIAIIKEAVRQDLADRVSVWGNTKYDALKDKALFSKCVDVYSPFAPSGQSRKELFGRIEEKLAKFKKAQQLLEETLENTTDERRDEVKSMYGADIQTAKHSVLFVGEVLSFYQYMMVAHRQYYRFVHQKFRMFNHLADMKHGNESFDIPTIGFGLEEVEWFDDYEPFFDDSLHGLDLNQQGVGNEDAVGDVLLGLGTAIALTGIAGLLIGGISFLIRKLFGDNGGGGGLGGGTYSVTRNIGHKLAEQYPYFIKALAEAVEQAERVSRIHDLGKLVAEKYSSQNWGKEYVRAIDRVIHDPKRRAVAYMFYHDFSQNAIDWHIGDRKGMRLEREFIDAAAEYLKRVDGYSNSLEEFIILTGTGRRLVHYDHISAFADFDPVAAKNTLKRVVDGIHLLDDIIRKDEITSKDLHALFANNSGNAEELRAGMEEMRHAAGSAPQYLMNSQSQLGIVVSVDYKQYLRFNEELCDTFDFVKKEINRLKNTKFIKDPEVFNELIKNLPSEEKNELREKFTVYKLELYYGSYMMTMMAVGLKDILRITNAAHKQASDVCHYLKKY